MENMLDSESTQLAWHAKLRLDFCFSSEKNKTLLSHKEHSGPLLVQKSLYPEGDAICHAVILHPPAGIAGGDHLVIDLNISNNAKVVITTPGATKWYKANKKEAYFIQLNYFYLRLMDASQDVALEVFYDFAKKTEVERLKEIQKYLNELIISSETKK